ncbi:transposase [Desmonostoc muscorum CCALA 125]|nr:transposase [Desmonostoc muscorum CCALA 125]
MRSLVEGIAIRLNGRGKFDKSIYCQRNWVERCFNRLNQFRCIATRYDKKADNYLAMLTLASIILRL